MSLASTLGERFKAELAGQLVAGISGALLIVLLARILEPDAYGLLFLAIAVLWATRVFSHLGIASSAGRYVAKYKETDIEQLPHIIRFSFLLNLGTISIVCAVVLVGHTQIATLIGEPALAPFLAIGVFFVAFATLVTFVRIVLQGLEAIKAAAALQAFVNVALLVFAVGFPLLGYGAISALVGYGLAYALAATLGLWYVYNRYYRPHQADAVEPDLYRRIAEYSIPVTATHAADVLDKRVDTILVGVFVGPIGVAYYTVGKQVVQFIELPISALGFTVSPTYESLKASGDTDTAGRIYEEALTHGLLLYVPAAAGLVLVAEPMLELVFGPEYLGAVIVLQVLAVYAVLQSVTMVTSTGLDYLGRARERAIVKGVTSVLNVGLNVALIPWIGVVGAAIATVITYSMYTAANVYIMHTELELRVAFLAQYIGKVLAITAAMSVAVFLFLGYVTGFVTLFGVVSLGVVVWVVLALATGLVDIEHVRSVVT